MNSHQKGDSFDGSNFDAQPILDGGASSVATAAQFEAGAMLVSESSVGQDPRVTAALEEYLNEVSAGSPLSKDEFLRRHAVIADHLEQCLASLEFIQKARPGLEAEGAGAAAGREEQVLPASLVLGDYRILRQVGRGSMGVVYEAEQISLGRRVALKVLPYASALDPRQRQRFLIEAQAAAQLHHPHIVPVFAAGCEQGVHFYAMQFVDGRSLAELMTEMSLAADETQARTGGPDVEAGRRNFSNGPRGGAGLPSTVALVRDADETTPSAEGQDRSASSGSGSISSGATSARQARSHGQSVARLGIQAAEALEHAHTLGVVHRDIKPANLMVDSNGELWITDFGLARFQTDVSLTRSGDLVGTLRYMSPEQALARRGVVDQRTDVYALGLTLYELLTLRPAFDGRDHHELLRQISQDEPTPPRRINPAVPRDLETIVMKAIRKEPAGRYATAKELADDLRRFRDDQPIRARRPTTFERGKRWIRRHKSIVVTGVTVFLTALSVGASLVLLQARQIEAQARKTELQAQKTEAVSQDRLTYIKRSFPFIDVIIMNAMGQVSAPAAPVGREEVPPDPAIEISQQALQLYEQAASIPPIDPESQKIVARATHRAGFARAVWSRRKGGDPALLQAAESNYRDALALFESLMTRNSRDVEIRSWYADALGEWGYGWFLLMTQRATEAEPYFRRAIRLSRELAADPGLDVPTISFQLEKTARLTGTVAEILERQGRIEEQRELWHDFVTASTAVASRLEGTEAPLLSAGLARLIGRFTTHPRFRRELREEMEMIFRLALSLDPRNSAVLNNMAWYLSIDPSAPVDDREEALAAARKAVEISPGQWTHWNTLGLAAYRAGDWKLARKALETSMKLHEGGNPADWFFLAMTLWRQNEVNEARTWFERAKESMSRMPLADPELERFRAEAERVLD